VRLQQIPNNQFIRFGKLEVILAIAVAGIVIQLFPAFWLRVLHVIDIRNWGSAGWVTFNALVVTALAAMRFRSGIASEGRKRRVSQRTSALRATPTRGKDLKNMDVNEQKELFKRMQEARRKQVF
jgi:hypothetical protein